MRIDIQRIARAHDQLPVAAQKEDHKPLVIGGQGQMLVAERMEVLESSGRPPGLWTRFKAALINLPLLGGLATIRTASEEVRIAQSHRATLVELLHEAAQFRDDFHRQLASDFGGEIAAAAVAEATGGAGGRRTGLAARILTPAQLGSELSYASVQVRHRREENDAAVGRGSEEGFFAYFASMYSIGKHPEHLQSALSEAQIEHTRQAASAIEKALGEAAIDAGSLAPMMRNYTAQTQHARTPQQIAEIARNCLAALDAAIAEARKIKLIEDRRPPELSRASHSGSRGAATEEAGSSGTASRESTRDSEAQDRQLVAALCASELTSESQELSSETIDKAWQTLVAVRNRLIEELAPVVGANTARADSLLHALTTLRLRGDVDQAPGEQLLQAARRGAILSELGRRFDLHDHDSSVFWAAVVEASGARGERLGASGTQMLEALRSEIIEDLAGRVPRLHEHFGCASDDIATIIDKTSETLGEITRQATVQHLDALESIDRSGTLGEARKRILLDYAQGPADLDKAHPRRLDPVQVSQYEALSNTFAAAITTLAAAVPRSNPAAIFDAMAELRDAYDAGKQAIVDRAETLWLARSSIVGPDDDGRVLDLCIRMAFASLDFGSEDYEMLTRLLDPNREAPHASAGAPADRDLENPNLDPRNPGSRDERGWETTLTQFDTACAQSPLESVSSRLPYFLGDITRIAVKLKERPEGQRYAEVIAGERERLEASNPLGKPADRTPPLHLCRPELLARTIGSHPTQIESNMEGGLFFDTRGVLTSELVGTGAALQARRRVASGFNLRAVESERHRAALGDGPPTAQWWAGKLRALGSADLIVSGKPVIRDNRSLALELPDPVLEPDRPERKALTEQFTALFDPQDPLLGAAIASCLDPGLLNSYRGDINAAAFDPPVDMAHQRPAHEVWRDATDGSWWVRTSGVGHPRRQGETPIDTAGVVLYTLAHHVIPQGQGEPPQIALAEARTHFAF